MAASRPLTCSICLTDQLKDPKFLQCHHTFCRQCLQYQLDAQVQKRTIVCPNCRVVTKLPPAGIDGLTNNFYIEAFRDYNRRHDAGVTNCDVCQMDIPAAVRCEECEQNYCRGCMKTHLKMTQCKDHTLQVIRETMVKTPADTARATCGEHEGKELAFCCADDDVIVCSQCWEQRHLGHRIRPLDEYAAEKREQTLKEIDSLKQTHLSILQDRTDALRQKVNTLATVDETITKIRTNRDELKRLLDIIAIKTVEEVEATGHDITEFFDEYEGSMKRQTDAVLAVMESTKEIVETSPDVDLIRVRNDLSTIIAEEKERYKRKSAMSSPMLLISGAEQVLISSLTEPSGSPSTNMLHPTVKTRVIHSFTTECEKPGCMTVMLDGSVMVGGRGDRIVLRYATGGHLLNRYKAKFRVGAILQTRDGRKLLTEARGRRLAIRCTDNAELRMFVLDHQAKGLSEMRSNENMVVFGWDIIVTRGNVHTNNAGLSFYTYGGDCVGNITLGQVNGAIEHVVEMRNGDIAFSTKKCVNVVNKDGHLKYTYTFKGVVQGIQTDANGHIIVLHEYQGVYRVSLWDAELHWIKDIFGWETLPIGNVIAPRVMFLDRTGNVWIAIPKGMFCLKYAM